MRAHVSGVLSVKMRNRGTQEAGSGLCAPSPNKRQKGAGLQKCLLGHGDHVSSAMPDPLIYKKRPWPLAKTLKVYLAFRVDPQREDLDENGQRRTDDPRELEQKRDKLDQDIRKTIAKLQDKE